MKGNNKGNITILCTASNIDDVEFMCQGLQVLRIGKGIEIWSNGFKFYRGNPKPISSAIGIIFFWRLSHQWNALPWRTYWLYFMQGNLSHQHFIRMWKWLWSLYCHVKPFLVNQIESSLKTFSQAIYNKFMRQIKTTLLSLATYMGEEG